MEQVNEILTELSSLLWGWPMIILLLGTHLYLTVILRFPQRHIFTAIKLSVRRDPGATGDVSQFGSLATALAATIGTGNIIGVATAISLGGPGAVMWCWLTGVFGISTKYAEGLLAIKYRVKTDSGRMLGGPMYALERGLGWRWLAILFAAFTALASFGIGNTVQANAIATVANETYNISPYLTGAVVCLLTAAVVLGGVKSIARVCGLLVPFMALFYVIGCLYILIINAHYLWPAVELIVRSAFNPSAAGGGFVGATVMMAARYGIARGLFSNESGMGSAPIVAAAAQTRNPVRQALVSASGTFWDTVVICALTGLVIVSSIIAYPDIDFANGATLTKAAFSKIPVVGTPLLTFGLLTFAFSTILGWCYYGERAVEYLRGQRWVIAYRSLYIVALFIGSIMNLTVVWNLADCMNALMAIPNLLSLLFLSGIIVHETRKYLWRGRLDREMERTVKTVALLCLLVATAQQASAQDKRHALNKRIDSLLTQRYNQANIDTNYISRPTKKWALSARLNFSGSGIEVKGVDKGQQVHSQMDADYKSTLSLGVSYLGISLNLSLNPAKILGRYDDYELNFKLYGKRFGFDIAYQDAHNFNGWFDSEGQERITLPEDMLSMKTLNVNSYYAFNNRKFSYPAAFAHSYIQRRSAGSFLLGASGQGQRGEVKGEEPVKFSMTNIGIGAGYGFNFVPAKKWMIHLSCLPTFIVYSNTSLTVNDDRVPLHYHFPEVIIASRGAIVHQGNRHFYGISMLFNFTNIGEEESLSVNNIKWLTRAYYGIRL